MNGDDANRSNGRAKSRPDWAEHTRIFDIGPKADADWTVYRVQTVASEYFLGLFHGKGRRRCAVLRGTSSGGVRVNAQDTNPLIGGKSLFDVPPSEWVGQVLDVGTTCTSPVRSATPETDAETLAMVTGSAALVQTCNYGERAPDRERAEPKQEAPRRPAYPEDYVEYAEWAANCLRAIYAKKELFDDLPRYPELGRRCGVALGECFLLVKALAGRTGEH